MLKNSLAILAVVAVLLMAQQPAEAGVGKRLVLRGIKWGLAAPCAVAGYITAVPSIVMLAGGAGTFRVCSVFIDDDLERNDPLVQTGWIPSKAQRERSKEEAESAQELIDGANKIIQDYNSKVDAEHQQPEIKPVEAEQ